MRLRKAALITTVTVCGLAPAAAQADPAGISICTQDGCWHSQPKEEEPKAQSAAPAPALVAGDARTARRHANRWLLNRYAGWRKARQARTAKLACAADGAATTWTCSASWRSAGKQRKRSLTVRRYRLADGTTRVETAAAR
jgi:hypothetical protein